MSRISTLSVLLPVVASITLAAGSCSREPASSSASADSDASLDLIEIGDLHGQAGDAEAARAALEEALALTRKQQRPELVALALALLACLPDGEAKVAESALADAGESDTPRVRLLLHQATGDRAHLEQAKRLLDEALSKVPAEYHEAMLTNVRLHRDIMKAWNEQTAS